MTDPKPTGERMKCAVVSMSSKKAGLVYSQVARWVSEAINTKKKVLEIVIVPDSKALSAAKAEGEKGVLEDMERFYEFTFSAYRKNRLNAKGKEKK